VSNGPKTLEELSGTTGEDVGALERWEQLGLIWPTPTGYGADAVARVRLIGYASARGITPEAIAAASAEQGDVLGRWLDLAGGTGSGASYSPAAAAARANLDARFARRLMVAAGLADQGEVFEEDLEVLRAAAAALAAGMPEDALLQLVRVYNDALTRVAEAENRLFHHYVHERLKNEGLDHAELAAVTEAISAPLRSLIEPTVLYFHSKAFQRALRDDFVVHLAQDTSPAGEHETGRVPVTVLFVDLASFTVMTEVMGDSAAAAVVERFSDIVREAAAGCSGRVLKQLGDEFMVVFSDAPQAVRFGLTVMDQVFAEPQFPDVRIGAHSGTALYREGDYLGGTVNLAARVTSEAGRGQFLISAAMRQSVIDPGEVTFEPAGRRSLKNVAEPVELYEVRTTTGPSRALDPVCGMAVAADQQAVRLRHAGRELLFCSQNCRDLFASSPARFVLPP
jgi:adenylate cyclase